MNIEKVITADKFSDIIDYWNPRIAAGLLHSKNLQLRSQKKSDNVRAKEHY